MPKTLLRSAAAIVALIAHAPSALAQVKPVLPTILVPGILGSKLCSSTGEVLWGSARSLSNLPKLELPTPQGKQVKKCGLVEDIQLLGPLYSIKAYTALREAMIGDFGFKLNKDLFVFDYDWRLSTTVNAQELAKFVKEKLGETQKFNILAHSMGGLVSRIYIENTRNNPRVSTILYLATPFLGSVSTFGTLSEGWGGVENWLAGGTETIRRVALSWPGMLELLPRYKECCTLKAQNGTYSPADPFNAAVWKEQNWLPGTLSQGTGFATFKKNLDLAGTLTKVFQTPLAGVIEVKFAGDAKDTHFIFTALVAPNGKSPPGEENWHFKKGPGDGTVRDHSAARDPTLSTLQGSLQSFAEHATIFDDKWVRAELKRELTVHPADTRPAISGSGHPQLKPVVDGEKRIWDLRLSELTARPAYIEVGTAVKASVRLSLASSAGLKLNAYAPVVQLRQGNDLRLLSVTDLTQQSDIDNRELKYSVEGSTSGFSEGAAEIIVSFPDSEPATSASEFVMLVKR